MAKVFLRFLASEDLGVTYKWHSDYSLYQTLGGPFRYVSIDAEKDWLKTKTDYSNKEINLMICLIENSQPIGIISVREIDWINRKGFLAGIFIGDIEHRGKGYGTEALRMISKHCFEDLGLNRIWAEILDSNKSSIQTFKNCGFEIEGCLRQHAFKEGKYLDVVVVGLCADQYFAREK